MPSTFNSWPIKPITHLESSIYVGYWGQQSGRITQRYHPQIDTTQLVVYTFPTTTNSAYLLAISEISSFISAIYA